MAPGDDAQFYCPGVMREAWLMWRDVHRRLCTSGHPFKLMAPTPPKILGNDPSSSGNTLILNTRYLDDTRTAV